MARCKVETVYPIPEPKPMLEVVLRMTVLEASTLKQVLGFIEGDPAGPRGVLDEIGAALCAAGVEQTTHQMEIHTGFGTYLRIKKKETAKCSKS